MTYQLDFERDRGMWALKMRRCYTRYFLDRYGAERLIARYRRLLHAAEQAQD